MILRCRLEELIKESGLRKDYIANELEISTRQLRNYELQKSYIPMDKAYILKDLLKLEKLDDLYEQEEELEHNNRDPLQSR
jgi:predicted transcriptional regulator